MSAAEASTMSHLHRAARWYAEHGAHVFPCAMREKTPATGHGYLDATTDLDQIDHWWTAQPDANIGIALGASGLFAVDVDGPEGASTLHDLEDLYSPLPATYQVITGRAEGSGRHHIYRQPDGDTIRNRKLGDHLETRGDGGYVIASPSIHPSGRPYLAEGHWDDITDAPGWLIHLARNPTPTPLIGLSASTGTDTVARKRLEACAGKVAIAPDGERNNTLNWAAYTVGRIIAAGHLDTQQAGELLLGAATRAGLDHKEALATIQSGFGAGSLDPDATSGHPTGVPDVTTISATSTVEEGADDPLAELVNAELVKLIVRERASEQHRELQAGQIIPPRPIGLDDFLAQPDPEITYRIDQLWPANGRVMLAAQFKAGKTTLVGNLLRSLADGVPFLGEYDVPEGGRPIVLFDNELDPNTHRRWLRDMGIDNTRHIHVVHLRGRATTFDLTNDKVRDRWARQVQDLGAGVVILDCLAPALDAIGLSEDKEAGRFLVAFDSLLDEATASEGLVVHHMGHQGDRTRGASRLRDWPDAEWRLIRDSDEEGQAKPDALRFFTAYGRDVDQPEQRLAFDEHTRTLTVAGGTRQQEREREFEAALITCLRDADGWAACHPLEQALRAMGQQVSTGSLKARAQRIADRDGSQILARTKGNSTQFRLARMTLDEDGS